MTTKEVTCKQLKSLSQPGQIDNRTELAAEIKATQKQIEDAVKKLEKARENAAATELQEGYQLADKTVFWNKVKLQLKEDVAPLPKALIHEGRPVTDSQKIQSVAQVKNTKEIKTMKGIV